MPSKIKWISKHCNTKSPKRHSLNAIFFEENPLHNIYPCQEYPGEGRHVIAKSTTNCHLQGCKLRGFTTRCKPVVTLKNHPNNHILWTVPCYICSRIGQDKCGDGKEQQMWLLTEVARWILECIYLYAHSAKCWKTDGMVLHSTDGQWTIIKTQKQPKALLRKPKETIPF